MKKMNLIDGQWLAGSTATPNINPSNTSDVIDEFVQADRAQAEAAIAAARKAFPKWALASVQSRADILDAIGSEILARKEELGTLLSREEGKTKPEGIGEAARAGYIFKFFAGEAHPRPRRARAVGAAGYRRRDHARAAGCGRHDHAVEFPARDSRLEDRAGACVRQLRRVQAGGPRAGLRVGAGRDHLAHRVAAGRVQPGHGPRFGGRRCDRALARRRRHQLHGLGADRQEHRPRRDRADEEAPARDGRQESAGDPRRCRPRRRGQPGGAKRLLLDRPALHRGLPHHRHRRHPRQVRGGDEKAHGHAQDRRCAEGGHRYRSGSGPKPARPGPWAT